MKKVLIIFVITLMICLTTALIYIQLFMPCPHTSVSTTVIAPTCESEGMTIIKCDKCRYEYTSDPIPKSNHTFSEIKIAPECNNQGYTLKYCECGYSYACDYIAPLEHSLLCETISPTCTEQGYILYSCENCEYSFKSNFSEPLGHDFEAKKFLPTSTRAGYTQYTCDCSYSYLGDYVYYSDILENAYTSNKDVLSKGLDVSRWNHQISASSGEYLPLDWSNIKKAGFDFVILKAGSTKSGIEPTFEMDYAGARSAGLAIGAYFYTYSDTVEEISKDAQMLLLWLEGKQFEYPIYLDLEDPNLEGLGKNHLSEMCVTFLGILQENGYYGGLYTNHKWLTTILDTPKMISLFDIWYARYPRTSVPTWNEEKYGKQLGMWQYTQEGTIAGIEGYFDFNYCYKDYSTIMKKWELNGF